MYSSLLFFFLEISWSRELLVSVLIQGDTGFYESEYFDWIFGELKHFNDFFLANIEVNKSSPVKYNQFSLTKEKYITKLKSKLDQCDGTSFLSM